MALAAQSFVGLAVIALVAWALAPVLGSSRMPFAKAVRWIAVALLLQFALAVALTQLPWTRAVFDALGQGVFALQAAVDKGAQLLFGYLAGGPAPFDVRAPEHGYIVAFRVLPMILVVSALVRLLYHWGILQRLVALFARLLQRSLGIGGPLATVSAAGVFLGLVEAPLVVRPYIRDMSRGALFATITGTMANVAGTVLALYATILATVLPGAAGHLVAASLISVPAALMVSRLMIPDGFESGPQSAEIPDEEPAASSIDAIVQGTMEGVPLIVGVTALLIVTIAFLTLANGILASAGAPFGVLFTIEGTLGVLFAPVALLLGIPWQEAATAGALLGKKVVFNEFLAYIDLARVPPAELSERSRLILTYALCGFANLGSLGISIGALSIMVPERRAEIVALTPWSVLAGMMATCLSGAVIGVLTWG
ncbi:MAG: NupC/NupG family nucleoside CNT transporter [Hyphomicrobiaceae bacterium]